MKTHNKPKPSDHPKSYGQDYMDAGSDEEWFAHSIEDFDFGSIRSAMG